MNREDIAWASGIFEGEGTIFCGSGHRDGGTGTRAVRVALHMSDRDVVDRFAALFPFGHGSTQPGRVSEITGATGKAMWTWQANNAEHVQAFLAMVWPWLGDRRKAKAAETIAACARISRRGKNLKKLSAGQVREIRTRAADGAPGYKLAAEYGVSKGNISLLLNGKIHT